MTSAFGVEHGVEKGLLGPSKAARRATGAAKAHRLIASKYEETVRGRPGAVVAAPGTRFKSKVQLRRNAVNENRGIAEGRARFHRQQAESSQPHRAAISPRAEVAAGAALTGGAAVALVADRKAGRKDVQKSAFGVEHPVEKAFDSERQRRQRQDLYSGSAAGGAVASGVGARRMAGKARTLQSQANDLKAESRMRHYDVGQELHSLAQKPKTEKVPDYYRTSAQHLARRSREATDMGRKGESLAQGAKLVRRGAKGAGITGAALAVAAVGAHRHAGRGGRSYGYR